ncbi:Delta2-dienoyl-CoA-isomerase [Agrocybe pediades]|nr:Delta2-dienoyl-CoA-isomerase [Agrocybe pediades]
MSQYSSKWIQVSEPSPRVLLVELARTPVNAFCVELWEAYSRLFDTLEEDAYDVRALVLASAFPKYFTAGLDLKDSSSLGSTSTIDAARTALAKRKYILAFQKALCAPERAAFPVIVALHGHIIGVGVDMIGGCDVRMAAENAVFSIKEVDIGFAPGLGTLAFLQKITSNMSLVRELTYTARNFSAREALDIGLVSRVVPGGRNEVVQAALNLAEVIASKSPVAAVGVKELLRHSRDNSVADNLAYTAMWNGVALRTRDMEDIINAKLQGKKGTESQIPFAPLVSRAPNCVNSGPKL